MISIFGGKMEKKNNQERSEAIPDEQGRKRRYQPRISQLMNWEWLSKEYHRKNPRN
jgi:hypothetical protein